MANPIDRTWWQTILNALSHKAEYLGLLRNKFIDKYHGIERVVREAQRIRSELSPNDRGLLASVNALSLRPIFRTGPMFFWVRQSLLVRS
jgi:hypothetical protein